ncbi:hypothetical protein DRV84_11720 [Rhodosalinus sediminis]|uniref:Uncharacterized protein n=1 Tax=Rhodosalinus sediminis TaxID=1940533 RepID=A0A3D9BPQ4_9RHOB|nr:hypothetical protein [Rhodosalinus sediminis]REC55493.1 hypothetical protein DRV84_11720 [Rhodosalinus sediminis]
MDWSDIRADWPAYARIISERWPKVREADLLALEGEREGVVDLIARATGLDRTVAGAELADWQMGERPVDALMDETRDDANIAKSAASSPRARTRSPTTRPSATRISPTARWGAPTEAGAPVLRRPNPPRVAPGRVDGGRRGVARSVSLLRRGGGRAGALRPGGLGADPVSAERLSTWPRCAECCGIAPRRAARAPRTCINFG